MPARKDAPSLKEQKMAEELMLNGMNIQRAATAAGYACVDRGKRVITDRTYDHLTSNMRNTEEYRLRTLEELKATYGHRLALLWRIANDPFEQKYDTRASYEHAKRVSIAAIAEINKMTGEYAPTQSLRVNVDLTTQKMKDIKKVYEDF